MPLSLVFCSLIACGSAAGASAARTLPQFDFTNPAVCAEWQAANDIEDMRPTAEGLEISLSRPDPYLHGPARDYPADTPLWLILRVKSEQGGAGQLFHFRDQAREEQSVRFAVPAATWKEVRVAVPALGAACRLRLDPPGAGGKVIISSLRFESAAPLSAPRWPRPDPVDFTHAARIRSGALELHVAPRGFRVVVDGAPVATSHSRPLLGYVAGEQLRWLDPGAPGASVPEVTSTPSGIRLSSTVRDADGATWKSSQTFAANPAPGTIDAEITVEADHDRALAFLPLLLLVAGDGSPDKGQALLPGLEHLDNEPSSSEADLVGPEARRQVPANHKLTFPLMALQKDGRYLGVIWDHEPRFNALFDSPDRSLGSGGHLLGVIVCGTLAPLCDLRPQPKTS